MIEGKISFVYHKQHGMVNSLSQRYNCITLSRKKHNCFVEYPFTIKDVVMSLFWKKSTSGTNARFKTESK
jgi:hypothetical protein